jgi:6-pyruvoyl-tetrahydropterin synthase
MFELHFKYRFEAAHRFLNTSSKSCMTPHGHTWYATLSYGMESQSQLDSCDMVAEFSRLKSSWRNFIRDTVDHSYLHHYADPVAELMRNENFGFRGLAFPGDPTTELIAGLFFEKAKAAFRGSGMNPKICFPTSVTIQETPTNTIEYKGMGRDFQDSFVGLDSFQGWWQDAQIESRRFSRVSNSKN